MNPEKEPASRAFWSQLTQELEDPEFRHTYVTESLRIQMIDRLVNKLHERQNEIGWTQADLASAAGCRQSFVRRLLKNTRPSKSLDSYVDLAAVLGLEIDVHVVREPEPAVRRAAC